MLIAVDPGKRTGIAVFGGTDDRELGAAYAVDGDTWEPDQTWWGADVVAELPTHYSQSLVDPNDLIKLAYRLGRVVGCLRPRAVRLVEPRTWKKNVPKPIHHKRISRELQPRELLGAPKLGANPDAWDAIGLGLWHLGRIQ